MTTYSITTKASSVAISETIKLAWDLIRKGQRGAYEIDNSADYEPVYTLDERWNMRLMRIEDDETESNDGVGVGRPCTRRMRLT